MTSQYPEGPWRHDYVEANGVRFHLVEAGSGPLVLLLHGFPEFWYSWRHQIPALAGRFRVVAPDLRGYNLSDKPPGGYDLDTLADDVAGIAAALGEPRCRLVGHDWGGAIAWHAAARRPDLVERLAILNAPHPAQMRAHLTSNPRQILRSWYIAFFQLPALPELVLRRDSCRALVERGIRGTMAHPERFGPEEVERYREAICRPGALEAALAYYREAGRAILRGGRGAGPGVVAAPTLVIWGERDHALGRELNDGLERWAPRARVEYLPGASHWVQQDEPEAVNGLLLDFLV